MHRLGDVVDVRLVEAAPVAGALRFELLSEGRLAARGKAREAGCDVSKARTKVLPGRSPRKQDPKPGRAKPGKSKSKEGKSWKP
jgi:ribonuclease R